MPDLLKKHANLGAPHKKLKNSRTSESLIESGEC